ncbi:PrsW family intramembrane metalloprotease [Bailinhaonella thermotolerans]|uniref:PrsW family intramembrane metalloprotease n=1 Tax=Bailinhaonella thermotolerans TaxID=1070861 RepID=UPI00192A26CC|nr:PrsW family intramembrane metalloprotease [Bailinhaonella thermotolerans]
MIRLPLGEGFLRPHRHAFWLYLVSLAVGGTTVIGSLARRTAEAPPGALLLAVVLYAIWLAPVLWFVWRLELFEREPISLAAAAFVWGGLAATGLALAANTAFVSYLAKLDSGFAASWGPAVAGPTTEETLKTLAVVMIVLINRGQFDRVLDGFVYGALAGLGFQVVEDVIYALSIAAKSGSGWVGGLVLSFVMRGLINGLWTHAAWSAISGAGIAYFVTRRDRPLNRRLLVAAVLCGLSWLLHFVNNSPLFVLMFGGGGLLTIAQIIFNGMVTLCVVIVIYRAACRIEYGWFADVVADDVRAGLFTPREVADLATNGTRRRAIRRMRGLRGPRLQRELQHAQIAYGVAKSRSPDPATDPRLAELRRTIAEIRSDIARLPTRPRPRLRPAPRPPFHSGLWRPQEDEAA